MSNDDQNSRFAAGGSPFEGNAEDPQSRHPQAPAGENYACAGPGAYGAAQVGPETYRPGKKIQGWKLGLLIFIIVVIVAALFAIVTMVAVSRSGSEFSLPQKNYLARISVVGEIGDFGDAYSSSDQSYHHDWTIKAIDDLIGDNFNKGLLLYVNSPGGSVYESDELYLKLKQYEEETKRPVYVYMGSMAASGGYYIAAPATKIYANRNTWTGSIGVIIGTLFDVSGFLNRYGIKATDITSGKNKGMGSYFEPMTAEQKAIFQSLVDDAYDQFVGIVADGRGMDVDEVRKIADGRIYTAKQALDNGLIDEIAGEDEALVQIKKDMGFGDIFVNDMVYEPQSNMFNFSLFEAYPIPEGLLGFLGLSGTDRKAPVGTSTAISEDVSSPATGLAPGDIAAVLGLTEQNGEIPIKYLYK